MSALDVRSYTVGPVQENCYIVSASPAAHAPAVSPASPSALAPSASSAPAAAQGQTTPSATASGDAERRPAVIVDPGDEPERLLAAIDALGVRIDAILITHCHFDHIGAVAPLARATGAPVYCPDIERPVLADVMSWVPPGFGPFESYDADHTVTGGDRLTIADLDIDVLFTPGHSPGHVTYAIAAAPGAGADPAARAAPDAERALLSGDVLFQGSVGRVDLPGGDWPTLERSIGGLLRAYPEQTVVYPGHMGVTTLGRERDTNPFLTELREHERVPRQTVAPDATAAAS